VRIRPAVPADASGIGETHASAWETAYDHIFESSFLARAAGSRRDGWSHSLPRLLGAPGLVLVAERLGTVVGFAHAGPERADRAMAEIYGFFVHPDAWGSGIAAALMEAACASLPREWTNVVLWTLRDAGRARRFYEKVGFDMTGRERAETLTDWSSGEAVERPAVEYIRPL
jgi:GNAT superfamily N-acetyltransferase